MWPQASPHASQPPPGLSPAGGARARELPQEGLWEQGAGGQGLRAPQSQCKGLPGSPDGVPGVEGTEVGQGERRAPREVGREKVATLQIAWEPVGLGFYSE